MPPKIPETIVCESNEAWEHELQLVADGLGLEESEDTWDRISFAIQRLTALTKGSAADFPQDIVSTCRSHVKPINGALNSERSRLSGATTDLIINLATQLGHHFSPLLPHFGPTLLNLATRSNKLLISRAKSCLLAIAEHAQLPNLLPQLREAVTSKSVSLRLVAAEVAHKCLNCFDPSDLETNARAEDIESIIRSTARDASADVRKFSRKIFEAYKILLPQRVNSFVDPLTPVMKKYLDIKPKDTYVLSSSSSSLQTNLQKSSRPFSASASPALAEPRRPAEPGMRLHGHVKSLTVESQPAMRKAVIGSTAISLDGVSTTSAEQTKPQRPPGTGPMRPPPHMRHAIMSRPEPIRPAFPSRPASAQSTHSAQSMAPPEPTTTRERAKRPPKPEDVPPPSKSSSSKSAAAARVKVSEVKSKSPEPTVSQAGSFVTTSSSSITNDSVTSRAARRVRREEKEPESNKAEEKGKGIQRLAKVLESEKTTTGREASYLKKTTSSRVKETGASRPKEPSRPKQAEKAVQVTKPTTGKPSRPVVDNNHSRSALHPSTEHSTKPEVPQTTVPQKQVRPAITDNAPAPILQKSGHLSGQSRSGIHAPTLSQLAKRKALPHGNGADQSKAPKKAKRAVEPLAIRKANKQQVQEKDETFMLGSGSTASDDVPQDAQILELTTATAAGVPLPESPPTSAHQSSDDGLPTLRLDVPPLPTPLRDVSATKYRMAATPISALLFSIERGFDETIHEGSNELDTSVLDLSRAQESLAPQREVFLPLST